jgi:hypothetical protein
VSLVGVVIVKFAHAIARVVKGIETRLERAVAFGTPVAAPFIASLPSGKSRAPILLIRGGCDRRVVAASSIPQGVRGLHHGRDCLVVASAYCFSHGRQQANEKHSQKEVCVWRYSWREMLFEFPHENAGLEALHFHGETKQFKVRLPLALS